MAEDFFVRGPNRSKKSDNVPINIKEYNMPPQSM